MEIKFELATEPAIKGTIAVVACVSIAYITKPKCHMVSHLRS